MNAYRVIDNNSGNSCKQQTLDIQGQPEHVACSGDKVSCRLSIKDEAIQYDNYVGGVADKAP